MTTFVHSKKDIGYGYRRTFHNGQRVDMIDYKNKGNIVLRIGRGAWLCRTYPMLHSLFDEVAKVIAKLSLPSREILEEKHIIGVLKLLDQAPKGIGYLD